MDSGLTRRGLLRTAGKAALAGSVLGGITSLLRAGRADAVDWEKLLRTAKPEGYGIVKQLTGRAFSGGRRLNEGSRVESGEQIQVSKGGRLILTMSDQSLFQMFGPTTLDLILSMMREGILNLLFGSILSVVPRRNRYLVMGPTGTIGIKGTVFFRQVFPEDQVMARTMEGQMRTPEGVHDYFCNCHGEVEYQKPETAETFYNDRSEYHNAFFLDPRTPGLLVKAPMINHNDKLIQAMIDLQEEPKHDATWLRHA